MTRAIVRIFAAAAAACAPLLLSGCLDFGQGSNPGGSPGTFSYYSMVSFPGQAYFCDTNNSACFYQVQNSFGTPMKSNGWSLKNGVTEGNLNGAWLPPTQLQANTVIGDSSNLVYFGSHGSIINGQATLCLESCTGVGAGGSNSISTSIIPAAWNGPTWLVLDACDVVVSGAGWEGTFGGNLHGILGFSQSVTVGYGNSSALGASGLSTFVNDIKNYTTAKQAWIDATGTADITPLIGMLIPTENTADVIEARGGPNFGNDGDTDVQFQQNVAYANAVTLVQPKPLKATGSTYDLTAETVNETAWLNSYGNPSITKTSPSDNEHDFTSNTAIVRHYVASGGVEAESPESGTAGAVNQTDAYNYALTWIGNNGGLPSDAVLSFAGRITNPFTDAIVPPSCGRLCRLSPSDYPANNNTAQWMFIWRHKNNGMLWGDKIQVNVDDAGSWTILPETCGGEGGGPQECITAPWIPSVHVTLYSRVWRTLAGVHATPGLVAVPDSLGTLEPNATQSAQGLCSPDMASKTMVAVPCQQYTSANGKVHYYTDLTTGDAIGTN
jgi:hypothetical protein